MVRFVNTGSLTPHYERFLTDKIRRTWSFTGCPIVFELRPRERKIFVEKPRRPRRFISRFPG